MLGVAVSWDGDVPEFVGAECATVHGEVGDEEGLGFGGWDGVRHGVVLVVEGEMVEGCCGLLYYSFGEGCRKV